MAIIVAPDECSLRDEVRRLREELTAKTARCQYLTRLQQSADNEIHELTEKVFQVVLSPFGLIRAHEQTNDYFCSGGL